MLDPLERVFAAFHETLNTDIRWALRGSRLTAITFSDSAFVVFEETEVALAFAQAVMRHMIKVKVPVRIGVGSGSFRALRFSSDIDPTARINLNSVQFLGTSIIRAHGAESCGVAGMRILLHPDFSVPSDFSGAVLGIDSTDEPTKQDKPAVSRELVYLIGSDEVEVNMASRTSWELIWTVQDMVGTAAEHERYHYERTVAALYRMRKLQQLPILIRPHT